MVIKLLYILKNGTQEIGIPSINTWGINSIHNFKKENRKDLLVKLHTIKLANIKANM